MRDSVMGHYDRYHRNMMQQLQQEEAAESKRNFLPNLVRSVVFALAGVGIVFMFFRNIFQGSQTDIIIRAVLVGCVIFGINIVISSFKFGRS